ncbi:MAG: hypothetical protein QOJ15_8412 [Bradyrhizobium sp.]|jgi:hypothetical protein|nr:hypothetical protein [Bradyrhizobium sp.]
MELTDLKVLVPCPEGHERGRQQDILKNAVVLERLWEKIPGWAFRGIAGWILWAKNLVSSPEGPERDRRQDILKNAVVLERLWEKLPGWVSRQIVDRTRGPTNWWPVALIKFKQPRRVTIQNANPRTESEASEAGGKSTGPDARAADSEEDVVVAAWRVDGGADDEPAIYFSAAKFDQLGFDGERELDDEVAKSVAANVQRLWGKHGVRVLNEFTLTPLHLLDKTLKARLAKRKRIQADEVAYDFGEKGIFRFVGLAPATQSVETLVYSGGSDRTPVDGLIRLLLKSIEVMHQSVGGGPLDPKASASRINGFLGTEDANILEIYSQPTSFYQDYALYRMVRGGVDAYAVAPNWNSLADQGAANPQYEEFAIVLDGTPPPIHNLNAKLGNRKKITGETATDYLCFFCKFAQGDDGAYLVPRSASDFAWREFPPVEKAWRDIVAKYVVSPTAATPAPDRGAGEQADNDGQERATKFIRIATVNYGRALVLMVFEISAAGSVATLGSHWLIKDLPVRPFKLAPEKSLLARKARGRAE